MYSDPNACWLRALLITSLLCLAPPLHAQVSPLKNLGACKDGAFSTEEDLMMRGGESFDGNPYISDGDLLSPSGQV